MSGDEKKTNDRREFLKITGATIAGAAAGVVGSKINDSQNTNDLKTKNIELSSFEKSSEPYPQPKRNRLSSDLSGLKSEYKVIVIGSGYGASVMAARIAEKSKSLGLNAGDFCMLERGLERQPGEFPNKVDFFDFNKDPKNAALHLRNESENPLGLYELHGTGDTDVIVGNSLGGTSNINANVALEPLPNVFTEFPDRWPEGYSLDSLKPHFKKVKEMLSTEKWNEDTMGKLSKVEFMKQCKDKIATEFQASSDEDKKVQFNYLDIAVNLSNLDKTTNPHGVYQNKCSLCGDCVTGCNVGAKNTLIMNYLPFAKNRGLQIFTQIEVVSISENSTKGGYDLNVKIYTDNSLYGYSHQTNSDKIIEKTIFAKNVIIGAGTIGTFKILQRSVDNNGLSLSEKLGHHYSGNADVLGTCYNSNLQTDSIGYGTEENPQRRVGPTIVSILDMRQDPKNRFLIEDGAFPSALTNILRKSFAFAGQTVAVQEGKHTNSERLNKDLKIGELKNDGALNHSMCYLAMGHDSSSGRMYLKDGQVKIKWKNKEDKLNLGQETPLNQAKKAFVYMSELTGGINFENPRTKFEVLDFKPSKDGSLLKKGGVPVSVHALGGCCMADRFDKGVVNGKGQVFRKNGSLYKGLYIADGSVVPVAIEANPFLTISAIAEYFAENIKKEDLNT